MELNEIVETLSKNVEGVITKSEKATEVATKANEEVTKLVTEITNLKEAHIKRDEADKKNQEALDKLIAKNQEVQANHKSESFEDVLKKGLEEHTDDLIKMSTKDSGRKTSFGFDLNTKAVGDVLVANYTGGTRGLTTLRPGIITGTSRKVHMRDIIPTGTIGPGTEFVFMAENGAGEGAIAPVAEGATKPQIDVDLIEASVKIETIAGWLRVTRKAMNNIQGFTSFLQSRLPEKLLKVEDTQILTGDGVSPNLKGITVAGNFTAATGAATVDLEQIVQAIGQLEDNDAEANGIVVRTSDYYNMLLNKSASSGEYDLPEIITVDAVGTLRILGIPVVHTTALTVDKFIVGDFRQGAQLLFQEGMRIEFFEQDGTNVRENKITVRIEETLAFPVYGSRFFVYGDFGNV